MTVAVSDPYLQRIMDRQFGADAPALSPYMLHAMDRVLPRVTIEEEMPSFAARLLDAGAQFNAMQRATAPRDRGPVLEAASRFRHRAAQLVVGRGTTERVGADIAERVLGRDHRLTALLDGYAEFQEIQGGFLADATPPSRDPSLTTQFAGDVAGSLPDLAVQVAAGAALGPAGFAGAAMLPSMENQYLEARGAGLDVEDAAVEALAAGVITYGTSRVEAFAFLMKVPGGNTILSKSAQRTAQFALRGGSESIQEMAEKVAIDSFAALWRQDPEMARAIYLGDPDYWSEVLYEGLVALPAGGLAGVGGDIAVDIAAGERSARTGRMLDQLADEPGAMSMDDLDIAFEALAAFTPQELTVTRPEPETPAFEREQESGLVAESDLLALDDDTRRIIRSDLVEALKRGIDPETNEQLNQGELQRLARTIGMLDGIADRLRAESDTEGTVDAGGPTRADTDTEGVVDAGGPTRVESDTEETVDAGVESIPADMEQRDGEEEIDDQADDDEGDRGGSAVAAVDRPDEGGGTQAAPAVEGEPPAAEQRTADEVILAAQTDRRPTVKEHGERLDSFVEDRGLDLIAETAGRIQASELGDSETAQFGLDVVAVHPDALDGIPNRGLARRRLRQAGVQIIEDTQLDPDLQLKIIEAAIEGRDRRRQRMIEDALRSPEQFPPEVVFSAMMIELRADHAQVLKDEGSTTTVSQTRGRGSRVVQRQRARVKFPKQVEMNFDALPLGARMTIHAQPFQIVADEQGEPVLWGPYLGQGALDMRGREIVIDEGSLELGDVEQLADVLPDEIDIPVGGRDDTPAETSDAPAATTGPQLGLLGEQFAGGITGQQTELPLPIESDLTREAQRAPIEDDAGQTFLGRADRFLADVEESARRRIDQRKAIRQPGRPPGARPGNQIIHLEIADRAILISAIAIRRGLRAGEAASQFVRRWLAANDPNLMPHVRTIDRKVQEVLRVAVDDDGSVAEDRFELEAMRIRQIANRRAASGQTETIKRRIMRSIRGAEPEPTVTEGEALTQRVRAEARGAREGARAATRVERERARDRLREQREKLVRARQEAVAAERERGRQKRESVEARNRAERAMVNALRRDLVDVIESDLPLAIRGKALRSVERVRGFGSFAGGLRRVRELLLDHQQREAQQQLKKLMDTVRIDRLRPEFRSEVEQVLGALDRSKMRESTERRLQGIVEFMERNPEAVLPDYVTRQTARLGKVPVSDLTAEEAEAAVDLVSHFLKLNDLKNTLFFGRRARDRAAVVQESRGEMAESLFLFGKVLKTRGNDRRGVIKRQRAPNALDIALSAEGVLNQQGLAELLGGSEHSVTYQALYQNLMEGETEAKGRYYSAIDGLRDAMIAEGLAPGSRELAKMSRGLAGEHSLVSGLIKFDLKSTIKADVDPIALPGGGAISMTAAEKMKLMAVLADKRNFDLIIFQNTPITLSGRERGNQHTLTIEDVEAIRATMSDRELRLVDVAVELVNGPMREWMRDWSVDSLGYDNTQPGTFYSIRRDKGQAEGDEQAFVPFRQRALLSAGIIQERTGGRDPIIIDDFFVSFASYAWQNAHVTTLDQPIRTAKAVINDPAIRNQILNSRRGARHYGEWQKMIAALEQEVVGGVRPMGIAESFSRRLASNLTLAYLGANVAVGTYQAASISTLANEARRGDVLRAMAEGAMLNLKLDDLIHRFSPYLRARADGGGMSVVNEGKTGAALFGFTTQGSALMRLISAIDATVIRVAWRSAELETRRARPDLLDEQGRFTDDGYRQVARLTERSVTRTQPTFDAMHISGIGREAKGNGLLKQLNLFRSQRSKNEQMVVLETVRTRRNPSPRQVARLVRVYTNTLIAASATMTAMRLLKQYIQNGFELPEEFEENFLKAFAFDTLDAAVGNNIFGGYVTQFINMTINRDERTFGADLVPVLGEIENLVRGAQNVALGATGNEWDDNARLMRGVEQFAESAAALTGVPVLPLYKQVKRFIESIHEDEPAPATVGQ